MLYMVIEHFKNRNAKHIYDRFHQKGRMMPDELKYLGSWTETNYDRCFQLMECTDPSHFQEWMAHWQDLIDFELVPVMTGTEAAAKVQNE